MRNIKKNKGHKFQKRNTLTTLIKRSEARIIALEQNIALSEELKEEQEWLNKLLEKEKECNR